MTPLRSTWQRCSLEVKLSFALLAVVMIVATGFLSFTAKSESIQDQSSEKDDEREIGIGLPKHIPLKIKTKNIKSKKWSHDLEIEVTNTADKPIYYLSFMVVVQGMKSPDGKEYMFWVHYGRGKLNDFNTKVESTDVPLMPKESYVLKIDPSDADGWEITRQKEKKPQPSKVGLVFQMLNFGDGTGYANAHGQFFDVNRSVGFKQGCLSPPPNPIENNQLASFLPALYTPVNFFAGASAVEPCCESAS